MRLAIDDFKIRLQRRDVERGGNLANAAARLIFRIGAAVDDRGRGLPSCGIGAIAERIVR
ncbi:hypothetical protein SDC9_178749 [bioreactor metagenome]|uniref:Uncharacterized protein n=1 Tax=bioreactor metagenome TaxID=1076179 RepID=A0A645GWU1_9ZZZZ